MKQIIKKILASMNYELKPIHNLKEKYPLEFLEIYKKCKDYSTTSKERMFALYNSVKYVVENGIKGDFVECGVWKGGSCMLIAETLLKLGSKNRKICLYDTYKGMTKPTKEDRFISTGKQVFNIWEKQDKGDYNKWCYVSIEDVKKNMSLTNYPKENLFFIKGDVEETIPKTVNKLSKGIALLRLDTDWYKSTLVEMEFLYPLLREGGVFISDDYWHFAGTKQAIDEYLDKNKIRLLLNKIDSHSVIGVK